MARFVFKQFAVDDQGCGMKVCTDSVLLGAWAAAESPAMILDLGAGSGLLALMCAQRFAHARITALEISSEATRAARANADASPWGERIDTVCADALDYAPTAPVDLIITNPPYFAGGLVSPDADRAAARHGAGLGPKTALDLAAAWLSPTGSIAMVSPADADLVYHAEMLRLRLRRLCRVSTVEGKAPTRALWQFSRVDGDQHVEALAIRTPAGEYTPQYATLTAPFYLNL